MRCWRTCCACRASCSRSTSSTRWPTRRRPSTRCATRCWPLRDEAGIDVAGIVPVSALRGDNVTQPLARRLVRRPVAAAAAGEPADHAGAHDGDAAAAGAVRGARAGEQADGTGHQPRTLWGRIAHGRVQAGDAVQLFPSGQRATRGRGAPRRQRGRRRPRPASRPASCSTASSTCRAATGSARPSTLQAGAALRATLAWLDTEPAVIGRKYWVRHGNRWVQARIAAIEHRLDIHTLQPTDAHELAVNDIGHVVVETAAAAAAGALCRQPRRRRADRRRPGQQPHQRCAAGRSAVRMMGRVVFIGAGPGAADLITAARRAPAGAGRRGAVRRPHRPGAARAGAARRAGSTSASAASRHATGQAAINALLVQHARAACAAWCGSRAATRACSAGSRKSSRRWPTHGIACEVVPGVTAALAAAAAARRPLTRRGRGRSVSLSTAMTQRGRAAAPARSADTEVFYMAGRSSARCRAACAPPAGRPTRRSCVVSRAGWPDQLASEHRVDTLAAGRACCTPGGPTVVTVGAGAERRARRHQDLGARQAPCRVEAAAST